MVKEIYPPYTISGPTTKKSLFLCVSSLNAPLIGVRSRQNTLVVLLPRSYSTRLKDNIVRKKKILCCLRNIVVHSGLNKHIFFPGSTNKRKGSRTRKPVCLPKVNLRMRRTKLYNSTPSIHAAHSDLSSQQGLMESSSSSQDENFRDHVNSKKSRVRKICDRFQNYT